MIMHDHPCPHAIRRLKERGIRIQKKQYLAAADSTMELAGTHAFASGTV
jgi:hypothetical protein